MKPIALLLLFISMAQAQVQPEAKTLLEKALTAHGGAALKNLKGVSYWQAQVSGPNNELSSLRVNINPATSSILQTCYLKTFVPNPSEEALLTPSSNGGWSYTRPQVEPLVDSVRDGLREELYGGVMILTQLDKLEKAEVLEAVELGNQKVTPVQVSLGSFVVKLFINPEGLLVGQELGESRQVLYDGYRVVGGVRWPVQSLYLFRSGFRWSLGSTRVLLELTLNPAELNLNLSPKTSKVFEGCFCSSGLDLTEVAQQGWQITRVPADLPYASLGLRTGDVVTKINGLEAQAQPRWAVDYLIMASARLLLEVRRGSQTLSFTLSRE